MIVIRREQDGEQAEHHGGAWKVAYADFVTAMMAFFLLMWLINATTEEQRTGLADYFAPTNLLGRTVSGSGQPFGGRSPNDPGVSVATAGRPQITSGRQPQAQDDEPDDDEAPTRPPLPLMGTKDDEGGPGQGTDDSQAVSKGVKPGQGNQRLIMGGDYAAAQLTPTQGVATPAANVAALKEAAQSDADREGRALEQAGTQLLEAIRRDPALADAANQLTIQTVPEGLRIQVVDAERRPMFSLGGSSPTPQVRELMRKVATVLAGLPNAISIAGHTDALVYRGQEKGNWELSTERANATRRILMEAGLAEGRIRSVTGNADRDLLVPAEPFNPVNRRISIIVLRHAGTDR